MLRALSKLKKCLHDLIYNEKGELTKGAVFFGTFFIPILFSVWGIVLSYQGQNNTEQIDVLKKILLTSDSTYDATKSLKGLPRTMFELNTNLNNLNSYSKSLSETYRAADTLNKTLLTTQVKYIHKLMEAIELSNKQINDLRKTNKSISNEYSRRPFIQVKGTVKKLNGKFYLMAINIENNGNIECSIEKFALTYLGDYVCNDSIYKPNDFFTPINGKYLYKLEIEDSNKKINASRSAIIKTNNGCYYKSNEILVIYTLAYNSKYIDTTVSGLIQILPIDKKE